MGILPEKSEQERDLGEIRVIDEGDSARKSLPLHRKAVPLPEQFVRLAD